MTIFNSRKTHTVKLAALLTMIVAFAAVPGTASARSSIHLDLPHFSIGFYDDHRSHRRHKYRNHRRHYNSHRSYRKHRYYNNRPHYNDHYYGYRYYQPRTRYYQPRYSDNYCPSSNYSDRYYDNRDCYSHGDHYHCEG